MSDTFGIGIDGTVPVIAWIRDGVLFCNAPNGYVVSDQTGAIVDQGAGPAEKPWALGDGYIITPNP